MAGNGPPLPEYHEAAVLFAHDAVDALMRERNPILARIQQEPRPHLPAVESQPNESIGYEAPLGPIEMKFTILKDDVLNTDINGWAAMLSQAADEMLPQVMAAIYRVMGEACKQAGTVVNAQGGQFSADMLCDALEKMDLDFDENDRPKMPTLVMPPAMAGQLTPPTAEQERRMSEIIERKRKEFHARRRVRKLDRSSD